MFPSTLLTFALAPGGSPPARGAADSSAASASRVSAWTEWGTLKTIVVGHAHDACFPPTQPGFQPSVNLEGGSGAKFSGNLDTLDESYGAGRLIAQEIGWPQGKKHESTIAAANAQLDNLARVLTERGVDVRRPDRIDWSRQLRTPHFKVGNQYCATCPRDVV